MIGDGNFFPFEHRFLAEVTDFGLEIPDFVELTEAKLTRFSMQLSLENSQEYFIKEQEPIVVCGQGLLKIVRATFKEENKNVLPLKSFRSRFHSRTFL